MPKSTKPSINKHISYQFCNKEATTKQKTLPALTTGLEKSHHQLNPGGGTFPVSSTLYFYLFSPKAPDGIHNQLDKPFAINS